MIDRPPTSLHGYRVLKHLGDGAASRLFVVSDPGTRDLFALKHVRASRPPERRFLEQAEREHAVGSQVRDRRVRGSRRILRYREMFRTTELALVLDFVDGEPLDVARRDSLIADLGVFADVAQGLAHLHALGWVHADLKPGNILRTGSGQGTVIDLGQACRIGERKARIQGTPGFLSPEQLSRAPLDTRTDAFLLGATIYRRMTGLYATTRLLDGESRPPSLRRLVASVPSRLADLVEACLQPNPLRRPSDLRIVASELRQVRSAAASRIAARAEPVVSQPVCAADEGRHG
ncbi:MAG: protein kinase [Planctomycetota bacterium]|nr:protein kinase [Planctomycetota bacterium]